MDNTEMEQRLWDYIDDMSHAQEKAAVEALIRNDKRWREAHQELLNLHQALGAAELEQPPLRFTKNVMEAIAKQHIAPAAKKYINQKIIWAIAGFFILSIAGFLVYGFNQIDWTAAATKNTSLNTVLSKIEYAKAFNNTVINGFMMLNAVLALMLLDHYLNRKHSPFLFGR